MAIAEDTGLAIGAGAVGANIGRRLAKKTKKGRQKQPGLQKYYTRRAEPVRLDTQEFRVTLITKTVPYKSRQNIDGLVESLTWRGDPGDPVLHGDVTMRMPDTFVDIRVREGDQIRLDCRWGGKWLEVFTMRLYDKNEDNQSGTWSFTMHDDGYLLQIGRDDFKYVKGKGRKKGWKTHQIMKDIAKRYRLKMGKIAEGTHDIKSLSMQNASPMALIQRAYAIEKRATGRRFVVRFNKGMLEVVPLRRNPMLYVLGPQIVRGILALEERGDKWATAVTVRSGGTAKYGGKKTDHGGVFMLGDSLSVGTESQIEDELGGEFTVSGNNVVGRNTQETWEAVDGKSDWPATVVIQLGTNDSSPEALKTYGLKIINKIRDSGDSRIIWATIHSDYSREMNRVLTDFAKRFANVELFDFNRLVGDGKIDMAADDIHPSGYGKLARLVASQITGSEVKAGRTDKKVKKVEHTYYDEKRIARFGVVHKIVKADVDSPKEAEEFAKKHIIEKGKRKPTIEVAHPGIAFVRRGDAMEVRIPRLNLPDKDGIVFCSQHEHNLSGGEFSMTCTFVFDDPYKTPKDERQSKDKAKRAAKRAGRGAGKAVGAAANE